MKYLYLGASPEEMHPYHVFAERSRHRMEDFQEYLKDRYAVTDLPNAVILTTEEIATKQISAISLPGYTNEFRTVFCPDINVWRELYLRQLEIADDPDIRKYYESALTENHVLQILGHEFVHHSGLFLDKAYETARWFEEGMCEYISRKYFLTEAEFEEETRINELLVKRYEERHGIQSPENFTRDTYSGALEDIFFFYWKSFLTVYGAVRKLGSADAVFREYHRWFRELPSMTLPLWLSGIDFA